MASEVIRDMKTLIPTIASTLTVLALAALPTQAGIYSDSTGENFTTAGGGILDITSVEVNNTASDLIFKINLAGDPVLTDWGKYCIGFDTTPGGDPTGDGWTPDKHEQRHGLLGWLLGGWRQWRRTPEVGRHRLAWGRAVLDYGCESRCL